MSKRRVAWLSKDDPPGRFPPTSDALREPDGLLAAGGDLSAERLLYAYRHGIFPWYSEGQPLLWWSPDPRCVFLAGDFHCSRRLRRELRHTVAEIRINTAFSEVMHSCAAPRSSEQGTWITPAMVSAYEILHRQGWAHSIEIWQSGELSGGLYGVCIGKAFFGESMFSRVSNASKMAMLFLANQLTAGDLDLLDCQVVSSHLVGLGARAMPRSEFVKRLPQVCDATQSPEIWRTTPLPCSILLLD